MRQGPRHRGRRGDIVVLWGTPDVVVGGEHVLLVDRAVVVLAGVESAAAPVRVSPARAPMGPPGARVRGGEGGDVGHVARARLGAGDDAAGAGRGGPLGLGAEELRHGLIRPLHHHHSGGVEHGRGGGRVDTHLR